MATFNLFPLSRFESGQTSMKRPREFTYFSYDERKQLHTQSSASLRYYYPPFIQAPGTSAPGVSLTDGLQDWIKTDQSVDGHLDALLETIQAHEQRLIEDGATPVGNIRVKADIVSWRGMLTKIMTAPFDIFSDFEMNATCYKGTIYIEENHPYKVTNEQRPSQPARPGQLSQEQMQFCGYKFEALSVLPRPWSDCGREEIETRDSEIINNNEQYCSLVRTGIGKSTLVLGGEVDCVLGEKPSNPDESIPWIELKTTAEPPTDSPRERQKFERKLLKFWAQSFLLGVPKVIVGYRSNDGYLTRIQEFETQRIPGLVARGESTWNGNICINMTAAFLDFLKATVMDTEGVWRIKLAKNSKQITIYRVEQTGNESIVPESFKAHREKLLAAELAQKLGIASENSIDK